MNLLLEAREIIRTQPPSIRVAHLRGVADNFDGAYKTMQKVMTRETITHFVAQANRLILAIEHVYEHTSPPPNAGAAREPRKQAS
jgi:hypothetical protein